jgi:membrane peptidoglycan carboxypeptidase
MTANDQKGRTILKNLILGVLLLGAIGITIFAVAFVYFSRTIPEPEAIVNRRINESTKIFDSTGEALLYEIHGEEKRTVIPWEDIPENIKIATLAAEDANFYTHKGIDFEGIIRAVIKNITSGELKGEGGSTITQQLVGNALIGREKTYARKIKEVLLALEVERRFNKDEIFWMYLNQVPYGSNAYGIEAASQTFFAKSARDLTLNEAATLAALPNGPTLYSPYGSHLNLLIARKNWILLRMKEVGSISEEEYMVAIDEDLEFKQALEKINAPHFVIMVKQYLVDKYGNDFVEKGGLNVYTTLDRDLQELAEGSIQKYADHNKESYNAHNAALVAVDPRTGHLLAMSGSKDYFGESEPEGCTEGKDCQFEGNFNVALAHRQPGSSFKPFAYSVLISKGYPDSTILFDLPTEFNPECHPSALQSKDRYGNKCYHPQNYTGSYKGPITLRNSLAQSLNVTSVKTLYLAGIDNTINLAKSMGITTLNDRSRYGLSLVLGGGEVRLIDMASAFGVFANEGIVNETFFIKKIEDTGGNVLEENISKSERVLDTQVTRMITDILSDNNARGPIFGYTSSLFIPGKSVAVKTGTTQENRDAWTIGYSPNISVGVWAGNNNNSQMTRRASGLSVAAPIWKNFMIKALPQYPETEFVPPDSTYSDKPMLNGHYVFNIGETNQIHNILFYVDKNNPLGSFPSNPLRDSQFSNWEESVSTWARGRFLSVDAN